MVGPLFQMGSHLMLQRTENTQSDKVFARLQAEVIDPGLCTHCGTCVGLSDGGLEMKLTPWGPIPSPVLSRQTNLPQAAFEACPGKGCNYPDLCLNIFGQQPHNWLIGCYCNVYIGYSRVPDIRRRAASGGMITQTLIYLLEQGLIDGAIAVYQGQPKPWQAEPIIAQSADDIIATSQSVYAPIPVNTILPQIESFDGKLAYVGLPDQVVSLRRLQQLGHPGAQKIKYVLGPYVGTNMYFGAIESYLRANGIQSLDEITELRYREGEWPGYLQIKTRAGCVLRTEKFYYNYLIPFYITQSTLLSVDFTNELTDISVGDAWHPRYEAQGKGFSVVVTRSQQGEDVLLAMRQRGLISLQELSLEEALSMHGHMLDFKKRGAFIRMAWRKTIGKPVPDYGYHPKHIPFSRKLVETVIISLFTICSTHLARRLIEFIPIGVIGPVFNVLRKVWKNASKPTKRKGLQKLDFEI
jgi:coenzyme F420 hydrogenase subunit beta